MNEWSHQGIYSGSEDTRQPQQTQFQRSLWEDPWDPKGKMNNFRYKDYLPSSSMGQHYTSEDICIPPAFSSRKKKHSDPRFKRVLNAEGKGSMYSEVEREKMGKMGQGLEKQTDSERIFEDKVISYLKCPRDSGLYSGGVFSKNFGEQKNICHRGLTETATKDIGFSIPPKYLQGYINNGNFETIRESEKVKMFSKTNLERSVSDCTLQTKNTFGDDNDDERVRPYPSATRVHRVYDWMKEYKVAPEKKRSVITVIGQTQTKPFSKVLHEINQRRKLAKELDRHALCEAIMKPEPQPEVKDLGGKVDFVLPDGKLLYSNDKVYLCKDSKSNTDHCCGQNIPKKAESLDNREHMRKRCEMIPERDGCFVGKKEKSRKLPKKVTYSKDQKKQDSVKTFYSKFSRRLFWSFTLLVCLSVGFYALFCVVKPTKSFFFYDVFQQKPTPWYQTLYDSWYERLLF